MSLIDTKPVAEFKLPPKMIELWEQNSNCKLACEALVKEVVREYEASMSLQRKWWQAIEEKYGYTNELYEMAYDGNTGIVKVFTKTESESREIVDRLRRDKKLRKIVEKALEED